MGSTQPRPTPTICRSVGQHRVVNHSLHFVDLATSVHTQHAKSYWNRVKTKFKVSMRTCYPRTWMSSCGGNVMEVLLPQLWQVFVAILLSGTRLRIPRCTVCWSTSLTVLSFCVLNRFFLKTTNFRKSVTW